MRRLKRTVKQSMEQRGKMIMKIIPETIKDKDLFVKVFQFMEQGGSIQRVKEDNICH